MNKLEMAREALKEAKAVLIDAGIEVLYRKAYDQLDEALAALESEEPGEDGCEWCIYIEDEFGGPCSDCCREDMRSDWYTPTAPKKE